MRQYVIDYGFNPKVIFMQNHGFIALGESASEVNGITDMAVKSCEVLVRTWSLGGPNFMPEDAARRIGTRPDEHYRKKMLGQIAD